MFAHLDGKAITADKVGLLDSVYTGHGKSGNFILFFQDIEINNSVTLTSQPLLLPCRQFFTH